MRAVHIIKCPTLVKMYSYVSNSLFKSLTFIAILMCTCYTIILSLQIDYKVFEGKDSTCCKCSGTFQPLCFLWILNVQEFTENKSLLFGCTRTPKHLSIKVEQSECFFWDSCVQFPQVTIMNLPGATFSTDWDFQQLPLNR